MDILRSAYYLKCLGTKLQSVHGHTAHLVESIGRDTRGDPENEVPADRPSRNRGALPTTASCCDHSDETGRSEWRSRIPIPCRAEGAYHMGLEDLRR